MHDYRSIVFQVKYQVDNKSKKWNRHIVITQIITSILRFDRRMFRVRNFKNRIERYLSRVKA